jgi:hypothetical protein
MLYGKLYGKSNPLLGVNFFDYLSGNFITFIFLPVM